MSDDQFELALADLKRRRDIVEGMMLKVKADLVDLGEHVKQAGVDAHAADIVRLQVLTFHANVLVGVMTKIKAEGLQLALRARISNENKNAAAPTIDPAEIEVPDFLPEEL